jgi:hypothetical protein
MSPSSHSSSETLRDTEESYSEKEAVDDESLLTGRRKQSQYLTTRRWNVHIVFLYSTNFLLALAVVLLGATRREKCKDPSQLTYC